MTPPVGAPRASILAKQADGGPAIPDSGVSRWEFEEGSGSTATDSWDSNPGDITGASYTTDAKIGSYALSLDGVDDDVVWDHQGDLSGFDNVSYSIWVYPTYNVGNDRRHAFRQRPTIVLMRDYDGDLEFTITDSNGTGHSVVATPSTYLTENEWTMLTLTYARNGELTAYADDGEIDSVAVDDYPQGTNTNILATKNNGFDQRWQGRLDDGKVYDYELSASDVQALYDQGSA